MIFLKALPPVIAFAILIHGPLQSQNIQHPIRLPATFHDALIFLEPVSEEGDTLRIFTDTAGGTLLYESGVKRMGLTTTSAIIQGQQQTAAFLPPLDTTNYIPPPLVSDGLLPVRDDDRMPPHHEVILGRGDSPLPHRDGVLGSTWFASRCWRINFREESMFVISSDPKEPPEEIDSDAAVPLAFFEEGDRRQYHFARVDVVISGDTLPMVLKTGSNIILSEEAQDALNHPDPLLPAGLISRSVAERWLDENPRWNVIQQADRLYGSDLIEVPEVRIGPHTAGPVRFAVRRDEDFSERISQFTDEPVVGAIGPDAFREAHITINYPLSVLIFHD